MDEGEIKEDSSWQGLATLAFSTLRLLFPGENSVSWSKSDVRGFRIFLKDFVVFFFSRKKNKHVRIKSLGELRSHKERRGRKKEAIDGADSSSLGPTSCCLETPKTQTFVKPVILSVFFGIKWCSSDTADRWVLFLRQRGWHPMPSIVQISCKTDDYKVTESGTNEWAIQSTELILKCNFITFRNYMSYTCFVHKMVFANVLQSQSGSFIVT